jgi:peptidyl-prolyl cis-trans isomerase C
MKSTPFFIGLAAFAMTGVFAHAADYTPRLERPTDGPLAPSLFVNGTPISNGQIDLFTQTLVSNDGDQEKGDLNSRRAAARKEMASQEALAQAAIARGMDKDIEVADAVSYAKREILARVFIQDFFQSNPVTESSMKAAYELKRTEGNIMEYKVRQILLPTREQAEGVLARLKKGEKFVALTKLTKDPGGSANGGYLSKTGWFRPDTFVDAYFADAVEAQPLKVHSAKPFRSRFGWHIILVEEKRKLEKPEPYDSLHASVKEALQQRMAQRQLNELIRSVSNKAVLTDAKGAKVAIDDLGVD